MEAESQQAGAAAAAITKAVAASKAILPTWGLIHTIGTEVAGTRPERRLGIK